MKLFLRIQLVFCVFLYGSFFYGQCSGCTITNPSISGTYTFTSGSVVCFTSNATLGDVIFEDNSKICVAPGVKVIFQNNVNTSSNTKVTFEIAGILEFDQSLNINSNLDVNISQGGELKLGTLGTGNFTLNGNTIGITNRGSISLGVLTFTNSGANNLIDNHGVMNVSSNVNITGNTVFVNDNELNITGNYNNTSGSKYINCGNMTSHGGFNLGGGIVVNTGNFKTTGGTVDFSSNSEFYNYGILDSGSNINSASSALIYNEGLFKVLDFQGDAKIQGPATGLNKKGYVEVTGTNRLNFNNNIIGPNLDFTFTQGSTMNGDGRPGSSRPGSGENGTDVPTNRQWIFLNMNGTYTEPNTITFDCRTQGNCSAPLVTNINVCANTLGVIPPSAIDDSFVIVPGASSSQSVLNNDTMVGVPASNSNVVLSEVSSTNAGITLDTATGLVNVAVGTPVGNYTLDYRICDINDNTNCDTATVSISVSAPFVDVKGDIHQIVKGGKVRGDLIYNDFTGNNEKLVSWQYYNASGALVTTTNFSTPVSIYDLQNQLVGGISVQTSGQYELIPTNNYVGTVPFFYTAEDDNLAVGKAAFTIKVLDASSSGNNPPVAQDDAVSTGKNRTINSTLLVNDSDVDGNALTVSLAGIPLGVATAIQGHDLSGTLVNAGQLTIHTDGTYVFVPTTDFVGETEPINYTINDGNTGSDTANLKIAVYPSASDSYYPTDDARVGKQGVTISGDVKLNDVVNGTLTYNLYSAYEEGNPITLGSPYVIANVGTITINTNGTYQFVPEAQFKGTLVVELTFVSSTAGYKNSTLYLTTLLAPYVDVKGDIHQIIKGGKAIGDLIYNDFTGANEELVSWQYYNASGTLVTTTNFSTPVSIYDLQHQLVGIIGVKTNGQYELIPSVNYVGTVPLFYTAKDANLALGKASFTIEVLEGSVNGNNPPVAQDDAVSTGKNRTINSTLIGNDSDADGDALAVSLSGIPLNTAKVIQGRDLFGTLLNAGQLTIHTDGTYVFVPNTDFVGETEPVNYTISDGNGGSDTANLKIAVYPDSTNSYYPTDDAIVGKQGVTLSGNVKLNDVYNSSDSYVVYSAYENGNLITLGSPYVIANVGTITINTNGSYQFVPEAQFKGTLVVELTFFDSTVGYKNSTLYLTVLPSFICYKPGVASGSALESKEGITALGRAGADQSNWPMVRKGAWLVLESKTKGFVVNRLTDAQISSLPVSDLVEGMMVYNITKDCLQINVDGTATGWKCFNTQTCPD